MAIKQELEPARATTVSGDAEVMKLLLEDLLVSAGVEFHLHSRVVDASRKGSRLRSVITESKSGREAWTARIFVDASGDGDLSALAGATSTTCSWRDAASAAIFFRTRAIG